LRLYFKGEITGKMLGKRIATSFLTVGTGILIGSGSMAIGAAIGTAICPGLGIYILSKQIF